MEPTVSVIIPVYQVEKYLDKCIASVVGQTYQNLQIILVDDGSTDCSPAICDGWKERDPRITVVHQPNGGLSRARNAGLKIATGEFIGFVDSDDWIEPNMVECLLSSMQETDADIAVGGFEGFTEDSKSIPYAQPKSTKRSLYSAEEALKRLLLLRGFIRNFVWNKLHHLAGDNIANTLERAVGQTGDAAVLEGHIVPLHRQFERSERAVGDAAPELLDRQENPMLTGLRLQLQSAKYEKRRQQNGLTKFHVHTLLKVDFSTLKKFLSPYLIWNIIYRRTKCKKFLTFDASFFQKIVGNSPFPNRKKSPHPSLSGRVSGTIPASVNADSAAVLP